MAAAAAQVEAIPDLSASVSAVSAPAAASGSKKKKKRGNTSKDDGGASVDSTGSDSTFQVVAAAAAATAASAAASVAVSSVEAVAALSPSPLVNDASSKLEAESAPSPDAASSAPLDAAAQHASSDATATIPAAILADICIERWPTTALVFERRPASLRLGGGSGKAASNQQRVTAETRPEFTEALESKRHVAGLLLNIVIVLFLDVWCFYDIPTHVMRCWR
jgi:hypothetical protein